ncbi:MAG TPA: alpha/beta hydrolase [Candidatus Alectryocaccomicrobium excrementavium]|uniref:Alpha/beta hydrolase n=1 Tax=Candidatus Alectryocaccomicrobium excrementavium TaxID=2840668 RepID=A0A9D1K6G6_9FIRM|nr:alpha/beta hydrolase [Candidatus Alectryocaccomicrobium excrementavium]
MVFEKDGYRIHYAQAGEGQDIVLLHGWGGCIGSWKPLMRDLSTRARVSVPDFPGHGQSAEPPVPWDVSDFARAIADWMRALGMEKADIVAHSFGGRVAIVLAAEYPQLVNRLVLSGVPVPGLLEMRPSPRKRLRSGVYRALRAICSPALVGRVRAERMREALVQRFGSPDYRVLSPAMRKTFNRVIAQNLAVFLPRIQAPVLLVWGDQDTAAPIDIARALEGRLKDAGLVVFEGADHFAYLREYPRFYAIVRQFLLEGR